MDFVANFELNQNNIDANFELNQPTEFDALFEINAIDSVWGNITGNIANQTDLKDALDTLSGQIDSNHQAITEINTTIQGFGDVVTYNAADFATSAQGALADTALQPNDNISELVNNVGYITSASLPTVNNSTITIQKNGSDIESFNLNQPTNKTINITVPTQTSDLTNNSGFITNTVNNLTNYYLKSETYTKTEIQDLISGITEITIEVVSELPVSGENGVIYLVPKEGASPDVYNEYIWVETDEDFELIGNTEIDLTNYVQFTDLSTVATTGDYDDLSNKPTIPTVGNGTITFTQGGVTKGSITTNQSGNTTIALDAGGGTVDQTFDSTSANAQSGVAIYDALTDGSITPKFLNEIQFYDDMTPATIQFANGATEFSFSHSINVGGSVSAADVYIGSGAIQATGPNYDELTITNNTTTLDSIVLGSNSINVDTSISGNTFTYNGNEVATLSDIPSLTGYATETYVDTGLATKQATLISGTNIKTINNQSLLGSGNITIQGGGTTYTAGNGINITNDTISIDSSVVATQTDISDMATQTWVGNQGYLTSSALTNYVTTDTAQDITAKKTFIGDKAILFKQATTADKLGFTLYNTSNAELAAFEFRPSTIGSSALFNLNLSKTSANYVGFRYHGTNAINIAAPKVATAGNYYIPINFTDGTNTVTSNNVGTVNISTLLPDISTKQDTLISGTNIKTINNTSILGSGNIDTSEVFIAEYGVTSYTDITTAINNDKLVLCTYNGDTYYYISSGGGFVSFVINTVGTNYIITVDSSNNWTNDSRAFPTKTSDLTNDSGYITLSALSGYATETYVDTGLATKQNTISDLTTIRSNANSAIQPATLNSAMKNKEDVFDQIKSPLAITYTNGLVEFNGSDCYVTSDGILTGDTEWCTVDVSADGTDIVNDYWEFVGEFIYNNVTADESVTSVDAGNAGFVISISPTGNVYNDDDPNVVLANIAADTWTTFRYVHEAGANTVEVTFLNSQGVLETHSTLLHSDITGTLTAFNWRVDTGYGIEFNLASPVCYYSLIPNGEHNTFLYRNLEMPLWYDSTTSTLNIGILQ